MGSPIPCIPCIPSMRPRGFGSLEGVGAASVLASAVFATKAKGSNGVLTDTGTGAHSIQHGSGAGSDTNDPLWLPLGGTQHLYLPGVSGNYASTPDAAAISVTGDIDIVVRAAAVDWTPASSFSLIGHGDVGSGFGWAFHITSAPAGRVVLEFTKDGSTIIGAVSTATPAFTDGTAYWLRCTRNATTGDVNFYYAADQAAIPSVWTQIGATVSATSGNMWDSNRPVFVGHNQNRYAWGEFRAYRALIYNGIGGTVVFDADFTSQPTEPYATFTEGSSNAATVTINRSSSGRKAEIVDRDRYQTATDDYALIADAADLDFAGADSFTVTFRLRVFGTPAANQALIAKKADLTTAAGWAVYLDTSRRIVGIIADGTNSTTVTSTALSVGVEHVISFIRNVTNDQISVVIDGLETVPVTDTTTGTLANAVGMTLAAANAGAASFLDASWTGAALWRSALTVADCGTAGTELIT